ncbi:MAG TPA: tetratricopeptide repeat protein [Vicinamibacterales bacterium]|nr:tetratricopeptide repeat protein [Vicinamibacterales bacterium]
MKAEEYAKESRADEAILEYRLALEVDPKRGDIHSKLAAAYEANRDLANAYKEYQRAADLLPDDSAAQIKAGNYQLMAAAYGNASFDDPKARAEKVLARDPKNIDAQILLGNALAGLKKFDEALAEFQEAQSLNPADDRAYTNSGVLLQYALKKPEEAEASFRKAVDAAPKSVTARMALASFLWSAKRFAEAEATLKAALEIDPNNTDANRALGTFYMASGRIPEAEPYFQSAAQHAQTSQDTLALADYYVAANKLPEARKVLSGLAADTKSFAVATIRLASLDAMEGNRAQAHEKLRSVTDRYPKDMLARLLDARLLLMDGKRDDALKAATAIVTDDPNGRESADAYLLIGGIQTSLDKYDEAVRAFEEVSKRQARPLAAQVALAALYMKSGALDKAMTYVQQAQAIDPKNPQARSLRIRILLMQGKASDAKTELASLQKDFPNTPGVLLLVAAQQVAERQYDAARATYTRILQVVPNNAEAGAGLVAIDLASGHKADAVTRVEATLKRAPTSDNLILAARTYAAAGDLTKAEDALRKAVDADPARLEAYVLLGQLYATQRKLPAAIDEFRKVVERTPNSISANTLLGMLYDAQQQTAEAEKQYQKVLTLNPRAPVAANNLAWIYVASNRNLDEALQLAQTALQGLPDEPHVTDTLGWIYYRKDMAQQAVPYLESSVQKNPGDPAGYYHLGMAYVRAGDLEKGRKSLQRALSGNPQFDGVAEARKTLAQLGG